MFNGYNYVCRLISIHAPRGGSDFVFDWGGWISGISIHAPRGGSDLRFPPGVPDTRISIHAPRGGSDYWPTYQIKTRGYFNPRSPWGERLNFMRVFSWAKNFNPRSPWGERHS